MSKVEKIEPLQFINPDMQKLFDSVDRYSEQFTLADFLVGTKLSNKNLTTTATTYNHGLGHNYTGYLVLDKNNDANIYTTASTDKSKYINLIANKATTATIWVF